MLERNAFVVIVLGAFGAFLAQRPRGTLVSDSWFSVESGRTISRSGIPRHDTLAVYTRGVEWVDQQWLAHLGIYGLWVAGGWPLALITCFAFFIGAFAVAVWTARTLGASERAAALVAAPCLLVGINNSALRGQIPAYVLFSLVFLLLVKDERQPSWRVFLVLPLLAFWANVHGSVVLGAGLVSLRGAMILGSAARTRLFSVRDCERGGALLAAPWLFILLSPYGLALPGYYQRTLGNSHFEHSISEWAPSTLPAEPIFFAALIAGLWLVFRQRGALTPYMQIAFLLAAIGGLLALRNLIWFALIATATVPLALDNAWKPLDAPRRRRINIAMVAIVLAAVAVITFSTASRPAAWFEEAFPSGAARAVQSAVASDPGLRVFSNEHYSDWLLFEDPELDGRIAYDVRFELLTGTQLTTILDFRAVHGLDWERAADGYGLLVLDPATDMDAIKFFENRHRTTILYRDANVVVLRRVVHASATR